MQIKKEQKEAKRLKTDVFPLNYFKDLWTPKQILKQNRTFNWFQIALVVLFLNALMIIPVSLHYAKMDNYPIENTFPNAFDLIDASVVSELNETTFQSGRMEEDSVFKVESEKGMVIGGITSNEAEEILRTEDNAVLFLENGFILKEADQPASSVPYTKKVSFTQADTVTEVRNILSQQWFIKNQTFVVAAFSFIIYVLLLTELILLVFGSAFFGFLTLKHKLETRISYKTSVSTVLYAAGVPTLAAMFVGLFEFNIILMITIQSVGMLIYIWMMYYQSRMGEIQRKKEQKAAAKEATQFHY